MRSASNIVPNTAKVTVVNEKRLYPAKVTTQYTINVVNIIPTHIIFAIREKCIISLPIL